VALLARRFLPDRKEADEAFTAAIVQEIGTLVLAVGLPEQLRQIVRTARRTGTSVYSRELETLGTSHAEIGAYLLASWGLPLPIVETVANHHAPAELVGGSREVLAAVHVADVLTNEALGVIPPDTAQGPLDLAFLEQAGLADRLPAWRAIAELELAGHPSATGPTRSR
jgi:HD-like signal output (HDOD) protein